MRKLIAAINTTLDGIGDHTAGIPDAEIHQHYTQLLNESGAILYGRVTFQLMQYWQTLLQNPSGEKSMDDFAVAINKIPKIVFSRTLKDTGWDTASLSNHSLENKVAELKQQAGKDILVGSPSLINQLLNLRLIDECQFCIHPVIAAGGFALFQNISDRIVLKLIKTKTFSGGAVTLYYEAI